MSQKANDPIFILRKEFGGVKKAINTLAEKKDATRADRHSAEKALEQYIRTVLEFMQQGGIYQDPYGILHGHYFEENGQKDSWAYKTAKELSEKLAPEYLEAVTAAEAAAIESQLNKNISDKVIFKLRSGVRVVIDGVTKSVSFVYGNMVRCMSYVAEKVREFMAWLRRKWDDLKSKVSSNGDAEPEPTPA